MAKGRTQEERQRADYLKQREIEEKAIRNSISRERLDNQIRNQQYFSPNQFTAARAASSIPQGYGTTEGAGSVVAPISFENPVYIPSELDTPYSYNRQQVEAPVFDVLDKLEVTRDNLAEGYYAGAANLTQMAKEAASIGFDIREPNPLDPRQRQLSNRYYKEYARLKALGNQLQGGYDLAREEAKAVMEGKIRPREKQMGVTTTQSLTSPETGVVQSDIPDAVAEFNKGMTMVHTQEDYNTKQKDYNRIRTQLVDQANQARQMGNEDEYNRLMEGANSLRRPTISLERQKLWQKDRAARAKRGGDNKELNNLFRTFAKASTGYGSELHGTGERTLDDLNGKMIGKNTRISKVRVKPDGSIVVQTDSYKKQEDGSYDWAAGEDVGYSDLNPLFDVVVSNLKGVKLEDAIAYGEDRGFYNADGTLRNRDILGNETYRDAIKQNKEYQNIIGEGGLLDVYKKQFTDKVRKISEGSGVFTRGEEVLKNHKGDKVTIEENFDIIGGNTVDLVDEEGRTLDGMVNLKPEEAVEYLLENGFLEDEVVKRDGKKIRFGDLRRSFIPKSVSDNGSVVEQKEEVEVKEEVLPVATKEAIVPSKFQKYKSNKK